MIYEKPITLLLVLYLVLCTIGTVAAQLRTEQNTCLTRASYEITLLCYNERSNAVFGLLQLYT